MSLCISYIRKRSLILCLIIIKPTGSVHPNVLSYPIQTPTVWTTPMWFDAIIFMYIHNGSPIGIECITALTANNQHYSVHSKRFLLPSIKTKQIFDFKQIKVFCLLESAIWTFNMLYFYPEIAILTNHN